MIHSSRPALAAAAACALVISVAQAQPAPPTSAAPSSRPDPLDARAPVPTAHHASPLARYRPLGEWSVGSWRDANDTVTRIGGWRAYTREAQAQQPAAAASTPAAVPPAPKNVPAAPRAPHGHGHGKH